MKRLAILALLIAAPTVAQDRGRPAYPDVVRTEHATPATARTFRDFFTAKSRHDVAGTMAFFAPDMLTYTDSTWGWPLDGFGALQGTFATFMPKWPATGLSYPVRIIGGPNSAIIEFVDTKELFGAELRVFGVVDMRGGKIIRWVDYWDSNTIPSALDTQFRTPAAKFPKDFKDAAVGDNASPRITDVVRRLQDALTKGDAAAAAALFSSEAVFEDRTWRTQIVTRSAIERYMGRAITQMPYAKGSRIRHIVGGDLGGGYEWLSTTGLDHGVMALELDSAGLITRASVLYDGRKFTPADRTRLAALAIES